MMRCIISGTRKRHRHEHKGQDERLPEPVAKPRWNKKWAG